MSMKNSSDTIWNRTRDLQDCRPVVTCRQTYWEKGNHCVITIGKCSFFKILLRKDETVHLFHGSIPSDSAVWCLCVSVSYAETRSYSCLSRSCPFRIRGSITGTSGSAGILLLHFCLPWVYEEMEERGLSRSEMAGTLTGGDSGDRRYWDRLSVCMCSWLCACCFKTSV